MSKGVVAILTGPDGHVWATATDFSTGGYGGFTLEEAQEIRAKRELSFEFVRKSCNDWIIKGLDNHDCESIVERLIRKEGFKRTFIAIGHEDTLTSGASHDRDA